MKELLPMTMLTLMGRSSPLYLRVHPLLCLHEERENTIFADEIKSKMTENERNDVFQGSGRVIKMERQPSRARDSFKGPNLTALMPLGTRRTMPTFFRSSYAVLLPRF